MVKGFFAYSSSPAQCGDCIEEAIEKINDGGTIQLSSWINLRVNGTFIINKILEAIEDCDVFCADLTGVNDNVLFELGYAIALKKKIWLIIDLSHLDTSRRFKELDFFSTIGYSNYSNSQKIVDSFYSEEIHKSNNVLYNAIVKDIDGNNERKALLYLKAQIETNYSIEIINQANFLKLPTIVDDACESKIQPLSWYVDQLFKVPAVLAEFSSTDREGHQLQNSKCAFLSGLSLGLGLKVLMIAEKPYHTPIDYRELLQKIYNRETCTRAIQPFLNSLSGEIAELISSKQIVESRFRKITELNKIRFGEYIAEHESDNVYDYYVETIPIDSLIKNEYNIIVGRKGTGKTATLYYLNDLLAEKRKIHTCLIKPINFEIDGLISLLERYSNEFEKGYFIESIWKFLIYTEIAKSIYDKINGKQDYAISEVEGNYKNFIESNRELFLTDFSTRLEEQIIKILGIDPDGTAKNQADFRMKLSEILHENIIHSVKEMFADVISKHEKIVVLIDNLDKSWRKDSKLEPLSKYILGLLGVTGRIAKDFAYVKSRQRKIEFNLTIFLRSDIFKYVMEYAREPDKIEITKLKWDDEEILLRIIEERVVKLSDVIITPAEIWEKYVTSSVEGIDVKKFILSCIIPRPRDIIYFLKTAKDFAVARGHERIEENDLLSSYEDYSGWVFKSLLVENGITIKQLSDFIYEFVGEPSCIVNRERIIKNMRHAGIDSDVAKIDKFIAHLISLSLIGREIREGEFYFEYDYESSEKIKRMAGKLSGMRYRIHNAILPYLEIPRIS